MKASHWIEPWPIQCRLDVAGCWATLVGFRMPHVETAPDYMTFTAARN
jgi:hypothetical protein